MKIKKIQVHMMSAPLEEPFYYSQGWVNERNSVIVEVETNEGICGFGECLCHGTTKPQMAAAFIENCYKPRVIGRNIYDVEVIWEDLYNFSRPIGQFGLSINALSGIDIAIWDAIGKSLGQPVYKLIGGAFRDKIMAYATGFYRKKDSNYPEDAIKEALGNLDKGFKAMKVKVGFGVYDDIYYINTVRKAIGFDILLMADFNCAYNQAAARRLLYELEDQKLEFFEELLAPEDMEGYIAIRNLTGSYIAAGENMFGKIFFRKWLEKGALDIYQPDLCSAGGFTECKKIAAIAQSYNTTIIPHVWGTGIGFAASVQYIATLPPTPLCLKPIEPLIEYDQSNHPFRLDLINDSILFKNGFVILPSTPGIGIEVNRAIIEKYKIK